MGDAVASIETAIAALEAQRAILGSAVVDAALAPLQRELERLRAQREPQLPHQQLKQVSVLFVDVVGSTAIGQRLNPEEINAVMDGALVRFTAAVKPTMAAYCSTPATACSPHSAPRRRARTTRNPQCAPGWR